MKSALQIVRSSASSPPTDGLNVAIIMDGNGRWAVARGLPRTAGHRAGAGAVRRTVKVAPNLGITTLTLYAFSSDNWRRPDFEVQTLLRLFQIYLRSRADECAESGVRIEVIGRRDRFSPALIAAINDAEARTAHANRLHLRLAVDYSAREAILRAAARVASEPDLTCDRFSSVLAEVCNVKSTPSNVDLMIRTGGERRLSDFLLWENAYSEFVFIDRMWPDFDPADLESAVNEFHHRQRRFGGLSAVS
jgi:undecaprenyl diphosphate synthase